MLGYSPRELSEKGSIFLVRKIMDLLSLNNIFEIISDLGPPKQLAIERAPSTVSLW